MNIRRNDGLTLIGFLIVLCVTLFCAYAAMRVIPMYLEYYSLTTVMKRLEDDPASASLMPGQIKEKITRSLWVSYSGNNIKPQHMHISKTKGGIKVRVAYEIRNDFLGNIDIIGKFDKSVILSK
jgi:hypothetical protein